MISSLGVLLAASTAGIVLGRLIKSVAETPLTPDPWGAEIERKINQPEAVEVCHHCGTPQSSTAWFCPHCGVAVGPYNNLMPWVLVFSQGEVLRNGVIEKMRINALTMAGYFLYSLVSYLVFAPVFWVFLYRNLRNQREKSESCSSSEPKQNGRTD